MRDHHLLIEKADIVEHHQNERIDLGVVYHYENELNDNDSGENAQVHIILQWDMIMVSQLQYQGGIHYDLDIYRHIQPKQNKVL